jgi:hypothetical protein
MHREPSAKHQISSEEAKGRRSYEAGKMENGGHELFPGCASVSARVGSRHGQ